MSVTPIQALHTRRSVKFVGAPGPTPEHLDEILRAAMCAPDHGRVRPWRFVLIQGEAVPRLGEFAMDCMKQAGLPLTPQKEATNRMWLAQVPLLIGLACRLDPAHDRIPGQERILAVGAAVTNMLNAAHMLGYGAYWSTGLGTYLPPVPEQLGLGAPEHQFLGYLAIGTPLRQTEAPARPDYRDFVTEWTGA